MGMKSFWGLVHICHVMHDELDTNSCCWTPYQTSVYVVITSTFVVSLPVNLMPLLKQELTA